MKDIADDLGVSLMTVSKALRNHSDISEGTRTRVLKRARELDYRPDSIARSLVTRRTFVIGLVIPDLMHSFFAEVAKGVSATLGPLGYDIVISNTDEDPEAERRQLERLVTGKVDGLIVASAIPNWSHSLAGTLKRRRIPYVLIDRMPAGLDAGFVGASDTEIGALATEHLLEQGCRRVAHIRGPALPNSGGRLRGYRRALLRAGMQPEPEYIVQAGCDDGSGYAAMRKLLALKQPPDGVFCYNDPVAAGAIKAVLDALLRVPEDVAIVGAGNVHYSDLLRVPLSTIDQSSLAIGETAARLLLEGMEARTQVPRRRVVIQPKLIVRESSRRLKETALAAGPRP
jgi:LacI family transcriptional regulator